jgi:P2X purinoceptor 4
MTLEYSSIQLIKVKNTTLALIYYGVMVLVLFYIAYSVLSTQSWQLNNSLTSNTFIKMKGSGHTKNGTVWDQYDMVVPPILPDTVFVGTNFILTQNQTQTECDGVDNKLEICDCPLGSLALCCPYGQHTENGMFTGNCGSDGVHCEMRGWCPFETKPKDKDENIIIGVEDWTLFVRINGQFPQWDISVANTASNPPMDAPNGLTLFDMKGIVRDTGGKWEDFIYKGGIVMANVAYNCNLDPVKPGTEAKDCTPEISFQRLDDPNDPISSGFNFRYIHTTRDVQTGELYRDLWKLYGVYVVFQVYGEGGKFDLFTLATNLGALAAYFSMSTVICDLVLQYFLPERERLLQEKFRDVRHSPSMAGTQDYRDSRSTLG